jgi:hypothetical protein
MVKTWWIGGKSWCFDGMISGIKSTPLFSDLFFKLKGDGETVSVWNGTRAKSTRRRGGFFFADGPSDAFG